MNSNQKLLYFFIILFTVIFCYDHSSRIVIGLVDDITHVALLTKLQDGIMSTSDVFMKYLNEPVRQQRPLSGFFIASNTWLGQHSIFTFYFLQAIYIVLFLLSFRWLLKNELKNEYQIIMILFVSMIYPFGAGFYFFTIMWQMYWVFILYFLHLGLLYRSKNWQFALSGFFFFLCLMFNEYIGFIFPISIFLIFFRIPSEKKWTKFILAFIAPILLIAIYRYYLVDLIYNNKFKFDQQSILISKNNTIRFFSTIVKTFTVYSWTLFKNSFINIKFYGILDYILLLISACISYLLVRGKAFVGERISTKNLVYILIAYSLCFSFCMITPYKPVLSGYSIRIFCLGVPVFATLAVAITFYIKNIKFRKIFFIGTLMACSVVFISEKNAWIYASQLNDKIINSPIAKSIDFRKSKTILFSVDKSKHPQFVIEEPAGLFLFDLIYIHYKVDDVFDREVTFKPSSKKFLGFEYDKLGPNY